MNNAMSNARVEATDSRLRGFTVRAYSFHSPEAMIAVAIVTYAGFWVELPGRAL